MEDVPRKGSVTVFDAVGSEWSRRYEIPGVAGQMLRERRDHALRMARGRGGVLLDSGCGPATLMLDFAAMGYRYIGVDAAPSMIAESRADVDRIAGAETCVGDAQQLPFRDGVADVAVCLGVLDRLPAPILAIDELCRVTAPRGTVIVSFLNRWSPYYTWRIDVWYPVVRLLKRVLARVAGRAPDPHLAVPAWRVGRKDAIRLFGERGFTVDEVAYFNFIPLPAPVDELLPRLAIRVTPGAERLRGRRWERLGGGFVVKATRES